MRWFTPLLAVALAHPAFGELAVYTGLLSYRDAGAAPYPTVVRLAEVIDLEFNSVVTIALTGKMGQLDFTVGPEVEYVIAKTTDRGRPITAFAVAETSLMNDSIFAVSALLQGRDTTVHLSGTGSSSWPRTLTGTGSLVAPAGTDTPARVSLSTTTLVLDETLSKQANAGGLSLLEAATEVAPKFRDSVQRLLSRVAAAYGTVPSGSIGVVKSGVGTVTLTGASTNFGGTLQLNQGTQIPGTGGLAGGGTVTSGGTINIGGSYVGGITITGVNLTYQNNTYTGGTTITNGTIPPWATTNPVLNGTSGGTLVLNGNTNLTINRGVTISGTAGGSVFTTTTLHNVGSPVVVTGSQPESAVP